MLKRDLKGERSKQKVAEFLSYGYIRGERDVEKVLAFWLRVLFYVPGDSGVSGLF